MIRSFGFIHPLYQAFFAGVITFLVTTLGSATVFFFKSVHKNIMDSMLSISAGIMLAASYFSLLSPAIMMAKELHFVVWFIILIGFILGAVSLFVGDKILSSVAKKWV